MHKIMFKTQIQCPLKAFGLTNLSITFRLIQRIFVITTVLVTCTNDFTVKIEFAVMKKLDMDPS